MYLNKSLSFGGKEASDKYKVIYGLRGKVKQQKTLK